MLEHSVGGFPLRGCQRGRRSGEWRRQRSNRYRGEQRQPLKVGWIYSEYGVFSMPFLAQAEGGPFVYIEGPEAIRGAFLSPSQLTMLEERGSGPIPRDFSFPWYQHIWGWLLPILALVCFLLWRREDRAREAAHWGDDLP